MRRRNLNHVLAGLLGGLGGATLVSLACRNSVRSLRRQAARIHRTLVDLLLNALSAGDPVTERHSRRVADLTDALARTYGLECEPHSTLRLAALLHDMGKIDDRFFDILHSCEPLSAEDREKINEHPRESADILRPLEDLHQGITRVVEAHHECWDGTGYPRGLAGTQIPLASRLISVADVFDALTQPRAYRPGLAAEDALREIRKGAGSRFDPEVVERLWRPDVLGRWVEIMERGRQEESDTPSTTGSPDPTGPSGRRSGTAGRGDSRRDRSSSR
jgi:putative nucleotidyltransferase with HDIG domain